MKQAKAASFVEWFSKDERGRWAVIQPPSILLSAWVVLLVVNFFIHSQSTGRLQSAVLFTWAYLELTQGASYFRKVLGAIVLAIIVASFFM